MSNSGSPTAPTEPTEKEDVHEPVVAETCPTCGALAIETEGSYTYFPNKSGIVLEFLGEVEKKLTEKERLLGRPMLFQDRNREWQVQKTIVLAEWLSEDEGVMPW